MRTVRTLATLIFPISVVSEIPQTTVMSTTSVLKTVTLYKNNLGFYEREASFPGGPEAPSFELEVPLPTKELVVETLRFVSQFRTCAVAQCVEL